MPYRFVTAAWLTSNVTSDLRNKWVTRTPSHANQHSWCKKVLPSRSKSANSDSTFWCRQATEKYLARSARGVWKKTDQSVYTATRAVQANWSSTWSSLPSPPVSSTFFICSSGYTLSSTRFGSQLSKVLSFCGGYAFQSSIHLRGHNRNHTE